MYAHALKSILQVYTDRVIHACPGKVLDKINAYVLTVILSSVSSNVRDSCAYLNTLRNCIEQMSGVQSVFFHDLLPSVAQSRIFEN